MYEDDKYSEYAGLTKARKRLVRSIKFAIGAFIVSLGIGHMNDFEAYSGLQRTRDGFTSHVHHRFMSWYAVDDTYERRICIDCGAHEQRRHNYFTIGQRIYREDPERDVCVFDMEHIVETVKICPDCLEKETTKKVEECDTVYSSDRQYRYLTCDTCGKSMSMPKTDYTYDDGITCLSDEIETTMEEPAKQLRLLPKK